MSWWRTVIRPGWSISQTLDLQASGGFNEGREVFLQYVDLSLVHVGKKLFEVLRLDVLEENDRVLPSTIRP